MKNQEKQANIREENNMSSLHSKAKFARIGWLLFLFSLFAFPFLCPLSISPFVLVVSLPFLETSPYRARWKFPIGDGNIDPLGFEKYSIGGGGDKYKRIDADFIDNISFLAAMHDV